MSQVTHWAVMLWRPLGKGVTQLECTTQMKDSTIS